MLVLLIMAAVAEAAPLCGERSEIIERLTKQHGEQLAAHGLTTEGLMLEVLASEAGGWTILLTRPSGQACVMAVGRAWQALEPDIAGEDT